jgi:hypothetical protein
MTDIAALLARQEELLRALGDVNERLGGRTGPPAAWFRMKWRT